MRRQAAGKEADMPTKVFSPPQALPGQAGPPDASSAARGGAAGSTGRTGLGLGRGRLSLATGNGQQGAHRSGAARGAHRHGAARGAAWPRGAAGGGVAQVWSAAEGVSACMSRRGSAPPRGTASAAAITARTHSIRCARLRCSSTNCAGGCANAASSRRMLNSGNIISPQCPIAVCGRTRALSPTRGLEEG